MSYEYEHSVTYDFKKYKENKQIEFSANTKTQLDNYYCLIRDMDKAIILSNQGKLDEDKPSPLINELSQQYTNIKAELHKYDQSATSADEDIENVYLSMRNIPTMEMVLADGINVYDIINANKVVFTEAAVKKVEEALQ